MTKLEWGTKRICQGCSTRFYDMCRNPIACPKCGEVFEIQAPGRRSRTRAAATDDMNTKSLDNDLLIEDIDLSNELGDDLNEDNDDDLIEDTSDLGEDLDDMVDVIDTDDDDEEQ